MCCNSNAVSVKLVWSKAGKSVEKTGETTSQAQNKKHLSSSTRRRNAKRMGSEPVYVHLVCVDHSLFLSILLEY
jgi:hypothetical protein